MRFRRRQQALQAPPEIGGLAYVRLGGFISATKREDGRSGRKLGKEIRWVVERERDGVGKHFNSTRPKAGKHLLTVWHRKNVAWIA